MTANTSTVLKAVIATCPRRLRSLANALGAVLQAEAGSLSTGLCGASGLRATRAPRTVQSDRSSGATAEALGEFDDQGLRDGGTVTAQGDPRSIRRHDCCRTH